MFISIHYMNTEHSSKHDAVNEDDNNGGFRDALCEKVPLGECIGRVSPQLVFWMRTLWISQMNWTPPSLPRWKYIQNLKFTTQTHLNAAT